MRFKEMYLTEAGVDKERQEHGFEVAVQKAVKANKNRPITLKAGNVTVKNVTNALKWPGRTVRGPEALTDIQLFVINSSVRNISMKGGKGDKAQAPSLAGGGLSGLETIIPGFTQKFFTKAHAELSKKYKAGSNIPDIFAKIAEKDKVKMLTGVGSIGGPLDYMYIGPMDVESKFENGVLTVNGKLTTIADYAKHGDFYVRFRKRRIDQRFDPKAKFPSGIPSLLSKSPSKGDSYGRPVIVDKPSSEGLIISL